MSDLIFRNRTEAGRELARHLEPYREQNPLVIGLPRGGVILGYEVAEALGAPLDVIVARKIGAPGHPEFAIGAVAPNGVRVIDDRTVRALRLDDETLEQLAAKARDESRRRMLAYRGTEEMPELRDRTVILVDDGLATGATARAAVEAARQAGARGLVLAVPVGAASSVELFRELVDEVVCLSAPRDFRAVGFFYEDFGQNTDDEVIELLDRASRLHAGS
ncbi:MAG: phosphoribosyltransferase [Opitutales bacterium]